MVIESSDHSANLLENSSKKLEFCFTYGSIILLISNNNNDNNGIVGVICVLLLLQVTSISTPERQALVVCRLLWKVRLKPRLTSRTTKMAHVRLHTHVLNQVGCLMYS